MKTLVFATNNKYKLEEIRQMLASEFIIKSLSDIGCTEELKETKRSIEGNALQKAKYVYDTYGFDCFADDTGLEVKALDGKPGFLSARFAGKNATYSDNTKKLLMLLKEANDRAAIFRTVIVLIIQNKTYYFEGIVNGEITHHEIGHVGFGYDPVFRPDGYDKTFAEMTLEEKNQISHRGKAVVALTKFLKQL
ncbi:MAG: RdgB/HAM1 family non-canonical purine NTP pyrophosphatase [Bacteroidales bacterium]|nr:RdgB/HAM1 family non-canonical purine NTP pyrophosphatase [Bacteroidales bacterium]